MSAGMTTTSLTAGQPALHVIIVSSDMLVKVNHTNNSSESSGKKQKMDFAGFDQPPRPITCARTQGF